MDKGGGAADVDKQEGAGGSTDVDNFFKFYNIIIKCRNMDKGKGGGGVRQCG